MPNNIQGKKIYTVENAFANLRKKVKEYFCKKKINI